jgi:signal transduction histidine kinase
MRKLWYRLIHMGLKDDKSLQYNREIILLNTINSIIAVIMVLELVLEFILYFTKVNSLNISTVRIFIIACICILNIYLCYKQLFNLAKLLLIVLMPLMLFAFPLLVGFYAAEIYLWYPYAAMAFAIVPLLVLRPKEDKIIIIYSIIYMTIYIFWIDLFALLIGVPNFVSYDTPRLVFTKVAQAGIFTVLITSVRYLIKVNRQYEDQLLITSEEVMQKSNLLNIKASELTLQNELLEKSRKELSSKNQELSDYQKELSNQNEELLSTMEELKVAQLQLVQAEKMASLGVITAGIAHEINNPINFVSSNTDGLKTLVDELVGSTREYADQKLTQDEFNNEIKDIQQGAELLVNNINKGIKRTTEIIRGLSKFSHIDSNELEICEINDYISSTLTLISGQYRDRIEVITHLGDVPPIYCFSSAFGQIILNLVTNAMQAIPEKGKIEINTLVENSFIKIEVIDTGVGIPSEIHSKIFEPFYTSKGVGKGTGLGLSITYNLVKKHHGSISFTSEVGKGTKFTVLIPTDLEKRYNQEHNEHNEQI